MIKKLRYKHNQLLEYCFKPIKESFKNFKKTGSPLEAFKMILFLPVCVVAVIAFAALPYILIVGLFIAIFISTIELGIIQNLSEILNKFIYPVLLYAVLPFIVGIIIIYLPAVPYEVSIFFGEWAVYFLELAFNKRVPIWIRIFVAFLSTIILFLIFYVFFIIGSTAIDLYLKINELLGMNLLNFLKEVLNS